MRTHERVAPSMARMPDRSCQGSRVMEASTSCNKLRKAAGEQSGGGVTEL